MAIEPKKKTSIRILKAHIVDAIKESCYTTDLRLYNIANEVFQIPTSSYGLADDMVDSYTIGSSNPGIVNDLLKIISQTVQNAIAVDCDLSVIIKGLFLGAFRARVFVKEGAHKDTRIMIRETLQTVFKYKGDEKQMVEGLLAAFYTIAKEFKLETHEFLILIQEDILSIAESINPKFAEDIKGIFPNLDNA